jgi:hypothetical protein
MKTNKNDYEEQIKMFFNIKQEKGTLCLVSSKDKPDLYYKVVGSKVTESGGYETELELVGLTKNG